MRRTKMFWIIFILMIGHIKCEVESLIYSSLTNKATMHSIVNYNDSQPRDVYVTFSRLLEVTSIESDAKENSLFFYIPSEKGIYQWQNVNGILNGSYTGTTIRKGVSSGVTQLAYDHVTQNLYWTDSLYNWIAMKPVYSSDDSMYRKIIQKDIERPEGLTIDTAAGYIFWSSLLVNVRIERSDLDGGSRVVLIHKALLRVISMTTDTDDRKLFWLDTVRQTVESCDYDGTNRRVLILLNGHKLRSIDMKQNTIYISSNNANRIIAIDKVSGTIIGSYTVAAPYAIELFGKVKAVVTDACNNRGCKHMCVNKLNGPTCLCKEGYQLQSDGLSCSSMSRMFNDGILFTNGSSICMLHAESLSGHTVPYLCTTISGLSIGAIAVGRDRILTYDKASNSIISILFSNTASSSTLLSSVNDVKKMFYNWRNDKLIWIDATSSSIKTANLGDLSSTIILYSNLVQPNYLAVDPYLGYIYWIEGASSIMKGSSTDLSSRSPENIVKSGITTKPTGLVFDINKRRLFFIDNGVLKSVNENGSDVKTYGSVSTGIELAIYQGYGIAGDMTSKLYSIPLKESSTLSSLPLSTVAKEIVSYNPSIMSTDPGPCDIMNGGCDHICLPTENGRICRCEHGFVLNADGKCTNDPMKDNFAVVTDFSHAKIYQISMDGKIVKALYIPGISNTPCAIFNPFDRKIYYAEWSTRQIKSSDLTGTNTTTIYTPGFVHPDRLAIDYTTGNLYYTAVSTITVQSYIGVVQTSAHKVVVENLQTPRAIVLYPSKGFIFWSDHGNSSHIGRSFMDGSSKTIIASSEMQWPNGLAIDYKADRIYWTDGYYNKIESCDLSGGNRKKLMEDKDAHMMDLVIKGGDIYYTAWKRQKVMKVDKETGNLIKWMDDVPEFGRLDTVDFYPADEQPQNEICKNRNGECSTFCFPTSTGRICGCHDNVQLNSDRRSCTGDTLCSPTIRNGQLSSYCLRYEGEICNFTCDTGYIPSSLKAEIKCGQLGHWDKDKDTVCKVKTCNVTFINGKLLDSCAPSIGAQCGYECQHGFSKRPDVSFLTCLSSGNWDRDPSTLCVQNFKPCDKALKNGRLSESCIPSNGVQCGYECQQGYEKRSEVSFITCLSSGNWDPDPSALCFAINANRTTMAAGISGGIGGSLLLMGIIGGIVWCHRRNKKRKEERERARYETSGNIKIECIINPMDHIYDEIGTLRK